MNIVRNYGLSEIYSCANFLFSLTRAQQVDALERILSGLEKQDVLLDLAPCEVDIEMGEAINMFHMLERTSVRLADGNERRQLMFRNTLIAYQVRIRSIQAGIYEARYPIQGQQVQEAVISREGIGSCDRAAAVEEVIEPEAANREQVPPSQEGAGFVPAQALPILVDPIIDEPNPMGAIEQEEIVERIAPDEQAINDAELVLGIDALNVEGEIELGNEANEAAAAAGAGANNDNDADAFIDRELVRRQGERAVRIAPPMLMAEEPVQEIVRFVPPRLPVIRYEFPRCQHCGENGHHIVRCPAFLDLGVIDRTRRVDALQLCRNCFRRHIEECWFAACHYCNVKHNSLLCPRREQI